MRRKPILVDDKDRVVRDREKARTKTMDRAVRLLAAKPRSVEELRGRLLEKLWTDGEIVEAVIEKLKEYRYLDDEQYARDVALSKLRVRPQGKRRLEYAMSQKKLARDTVATAVTAAFEQLPESDLIDTAIEKRLRLKGEPATREELKKFQEHLLRLGFSYGLIRERMAAIASQDPDTSA